MRWLLLISFLLAPIAAAANEEEKGRLTKFIEDSLSGAGRSVEIEGFEGALSSNASMKSLVISDAKGPWLTLKDVELVWTRSALLRGRVEVEKLTAAEILLPRLPETEKQPPSPEASGSFALPELPVSIDIGEINAGKLAFGEDVFGVASTFSLTGAMQLEGGEGAINLDITRTDGQQGHIRLEGGYANATKTLLIDLGLEEEPGGILATLMSLPGSPSVVLSIEGSGPIDTYVANIRLATDDEDRLTGTVATAIRAETDNNEVQTGEARLIGVDLIGDLAPLFAPEFRSFFGTNMSLTSVVRRPSDGRTRMDQLLINTRSLQVAGEMTLAPGGLPEFLAFDINLVDPEGARIPIPGADGLSIGEGRFEARFDAAQGDAWSLSGRLQEVIGANLSSAVVNLDGGGIIRDIENPEVSASVSLNAIGLRATSAEAEEIAEALGPIARLSTKLNWQASQPLEIESLAFETDRSAINASATVTGPLETVQVDGKVDADIADLAFLEPLLKRPVRGSATASLTGVVSPLAGLMDIRLSATGSQVLTGEKMVDALTGEKVTLHTSAVRDEDGVELRNLKVTSDAIDASAKGNLKTGQGALEFQFALDDARRLSPDFSGPVNVSGNASETAEGWLADITGKAPGETTVDLNLNVPKSGGGSVELIAELGRVQTFFPTLPGSASLQAKATRLTSGWDIDMSGEGSSGFQLTASGEVDDALENANLAIKGAFPLEVANIAIRPTSIQGRSSFDLALKGPLALESLSGTIQTSGTRVALPQIKAALSDLSATIGLSKGTASIDLNTAVAAGGRIGVNGTLGLAAPFNGSLAINLDQTRFQYENLLETVLAGQVDVNGPLTGGASIAGEILLESTEIKVSTNALGGVSELPQIVHRNADSNITRTRQFAGAIKTERPERSGQSRPFVLDLAIRADNRVFVRGLGLDAEFEGGFNLNGPTTAIVTSGEFDLSRGRLDFLTKRLDLTEGVVRLEGDFIPYLRMIAETESSDASFEIMLEGRATAPELSISSSPDMPEEEALSQILFGQNLNDISAFQAAQLASALSAMRGGSGGKFGSRLRKGLGVDNLDITTDDEGNAGLSAGKHLNDRVYTEIGVDGKGESSISLNLDVTPSLTVTGRVDSDSDTGIGLFFRRDY